jgi:hypothetical protein
MFPKSGRGFEQAVHSKGLMKDSMQTDRLYFGGVRFIHRSKMSTAWCIM